MEIDNPTINKIINHNILLNSIRVPKEIMIDNLLDIKIELLKEIDLISIIMEEEEEDQGKEITNLLLDLLSGKNKEISIVLYVENLILPLGISAECVERERIRI